MQPDVAHDTNTADERILESLLAGRNLPQNLADELDYSRQYVQNRLQMLKAADLVTKHGGGLYEITDDGRTEIDADTDEARHPAEARVQKLEQRLEDLRAERDRLQDELDSNDGVDRQALRRAHADIESAAERGDKAMLEDALERAREEIDR